MQPRPQPTHFCAQSFSDRIFRAPTRRKVVWAQDYYSQRRTRLHVLMSLSSLVPTTLSEGVWAQGLVVMPTQQNLAWY